MRVPSTEVQNNFGKYLKFAEANEEIIVTRKGKDVARIVPCREPRTDYVHERARDYAAGGDRVSYEQFLELAEASEQRYELIDGVVYSLASPSYQHQVAVHELHGAFYNWFKGKSCTPLTSPFDITIRRAEDNICVVQPDIVVICDRDNRDEKDQYRGIPSLAAEVLSPSTRGKDMVKKLDLYMQCGVNEYWVVDPMQRLVMAYRLAEGEIKDHRTYVLGAHRTAASFCYEGLQVALDDLFAE